jgi:hypothetical protein
VTAGQGQATSFGTVAGNYDRVRPGPAPAALDWLVPAGCEVAVDLAAGTGLFTRALLGRATNSVFITAPAAERAAGLARCREALLRRAVPGPGGEGPVVGMPARSWCWRGRRR